MRVPQRIVDEIYQKLDIVEVIADFVLLKKEGTNFKGKSPFQDEKTPSFVVSPSKQIFKCFSTGIGGNAIKFLEASEGMNYREALEHIARKYNISIQANEKDQAEYDHRQAFIEVNESVCDLYHSHLSETSYPKDRDIWFETQITFKLGFAPDAWHTVGKAFHFDPPGNPLLELGLVKESDKGRNDYDVFRNRLIFPIHDISGNIVGFGGRDLSNKKGSAKYINSKETFLYQKSRILYNLHRARNHILRADEAYLSEGYMDVVMPWQYGIKNIVATCGTALTEAQAKLLKRYTSNVSIIYDADKAGIKAAQKAVQIFLKAGMNPQVLLLPEGYDPDQYLRENGLETFEQYKNENLMEWPDFIIHSLGLSAKDSADPAFQAKLIKKLAQLIKLLPDPIERELRYKKIQDTFSINLIENNGKIQVSPNQLSPAGSTENQKEYHADSGGKAQNLSDQTSQNHHNLKLSLKRSWREFEMIRQTLDLPENPDFSQASNGKLQIHYFDVYDKPYRISLAGKKSNATRITSSLDKPNVAYIPPALRSNDTGSYEDLPLILVRDEVTAFILSEFGIPAIGLHSSTGFLSRKGKKDPHSLIRGALDHHGFKSLIYILDHEPWTLPQGSQGDFPFEHINVAANAQKGVDTICLLQESFRKHNIDILFPWKDGPIERNRILWLDRFILSEYQKLETEDSEGKTLAMNDLLHELIEPTANHFFEIKRHISSKTQYLFEEYLSVHEVNAFLRLHGIHRIGNRFQFRQNIYEYNSVQQTASIYGDSQDQLEVWENSGAYYARERSGHKRISNFRMDCLMEVKGEDPFGLYELRNRFGQTANILFYEDDFLEIKSFKRKIRQSYGEFMFTGNSTQAQQIQEQLIMGTEKGQSLAGKLGFYKPRKMAGEAGRSPFYVWGNGILDLRTSEFKEVNEEGLAEHEGKKYFLEAFSSYNRSENVKDDFEYEIGFYYTETAIEFNEWRDLFMKVHGFNGHVGFSFLLMALFWDIFQAKFGRSPFLSLQGPRGAGKGQLMDSLTAFFGKLVYFNMQTNSSVFAFNQHVTRYQNALVILNEFNPSTLSEYYKLSPKAWYDGEGRRKGSIKTKNKTTAETPTSAQIFTGQESFYEFEASVSRGIICDFERTTYGTEATKLKNQLVQMEQEGITGFVAKFLKHRPLIEEKMPTLHEKLEIELRERCQNAGVSIDARLFFNWACLLSPLLLMIENKVFQYHMDREEIMQTAKKRITHQAMRMAKEGTLSLFLEFLSSEYGQPRGLDHQDMFIYHSRIRIRYNSCYTKFYAWLKRYGNVESAKKDDILRKLREHKAFIKEAKGGMWIGYRKNELGKILHDLKGKPVKATTRGLEMDLAKLDLDLPLIDWLGTNEIPEEEEEETTI